MPKILGGQPPGKIGRCRHKPTEKLLGRFFFLKYASIAQSVEHAAVNRSVKGSSPFGGGYRVHTDSVIFFIWPRGQEVKTSPFHGGNTGSIPVGVIIVNHS